MAKGRPNKKAGILKRAVETLADAINGVAERASIEMWFAPWLRTHVAAGQRDGCVWLASEYRVPLHAALRRGANRYRSFLERASPPVTDRAHYAFDQVEEAYVAGFLYEVEAFVAGLPAVLVASMEPTGNVPVDGVCDVRDTE